MRLVVRIVVLLATLAAIAAAGMYLHLRRSLPVLEGEIAVAGLSGRVEILRDPYGIPHIFAASVEDAQLALGFVHAQDRLWQMEMNRRIGSGRLAEILGPRALEADRFLRTLGVRRVAEANLRRYDKETLALLQAYAAGVNAFLDSGPVLPPEFWLLRASPEPWTPADTVVWTKMMAWDLGGNWRNELLRLRMSKTMLRARVEEFFPPYPGDAPAKLPELIAEVEADATLASALDMLHFTGGASNSWVLNGARTATGKPLLANDPVSYTHLTLPTILLV